MKTYLNQYVMLVLAGVLGVTVGSTVTYFTVKGKVLADSEREIAEARDRYRRLLFEEKQGIDERVLNLARQLAEESVKDALANSIAKSQDADTDSEQTDSEQTDSEQATDEARDRRLKYEAEGTEEVEMDGALPAELDDPDFDSEEPFLIKKSQYMNGDRDYSRRMLFYFDEEDLLVDENFMPVESGPNMTGDCLWALDEHETIHIRNPILNVDLEVSLRSDTYAEALMGVRDRKAGKRQLRMRDEQD